MAPRCAIPKSLQKMVLRHRRSAATRPGSRPCLTTEIGKASQAEPALLRVNLRNRGTPATHQAPWGLSNGGPAGRPGPGGNYRPQIVNWIRSELSFMLLVTLEPGGTRGFGIGPLWVFSGT
jgi:hypothetical protein